MSAAFDAEAHARLMAPAMQLVMADEWLRDVAATLAVTAAMAELVAGLPLDDQVEPAPVFEA
jgi:hypothetical protein